MDMVSGQYFRRRGIISRGLPAYLSLIIIIISSTTAAVANAHYVDKPHSRINALPPNLCMCFRGAKGSVEPDSTDTHIMPVLNEMMRKQSFN